MGIEQALAGLEEATSSGTRYPYIEAGNHLFKIVHAEFRNGYKGKSFIFHLEVLQSEVHPKDSKVSWIKKMPSEDEPLKRGYALGDIKNFCAAALKLDEEAVTIPGVAKALDSDAFIDVVLGCEGYTTESGHVNTRFTAVDLDAE